MKNLRDSYEYKKGYVEGYEEGLRVAIADLVKSVEPSTGIPLILPEREEEFPPRFLVRCIKDTDHFTKGLLYRVKNANGELRAEDNFYEPKLDNYHIIKKSHDYEESYDDSWLREHFEIIK